MGTQRLTTKQGVNLVKVTVSGWVVASLWKWAAVVNHIVIQSITGLGDSVEAAACVRINASSETQNKEKELRDFAEVTTC